MKIKSKIDHHDRLQQEEDYQVYGRLRVDQTAELRPCDFCGKTFSSGKALGGHRRIHFQHRDRNPVTKPKPSSDRRTFPTETKKFQHETDCSDHGSGSSAISDGDNTAVNLLTFLTGWSRKDRRGIRNADQERKDEDNNANVLNLNRDSDYTVVPFKKRKVEYQKMNTHSSSVSEKRFNKSFSSFQALGGHTSSHFKVQIHNKSREEQQREHRCKICHKTFASGQALGGHQRRHWTGPSSPCAFGSDQVAAPVPVERENSIPKRTSSLFDLNELPSLEV